MNKLQVIDSSIIIPYKSLKDNVSFPNLKTNEIDFLCETIIELYKNESEIISIPFSELFNKLDVKEDEYTKTQIAKWVDELSLKASKLICPMMLIDPEDSNTFAYIPFFGSVSFNLNKNVINFKVNSFIYEITQVVAESSATTLSLENLTSLERKYSKKLFNILSKIKKNGSCTFSVDEFRRLLDIPDSYKKASKIQQVVIDPSIKDLSSIFPDLSYEPIKNKRKIIEYKFTWLTSRSKDEVNHK